MLQREHSAIGSTFIKLPVVIKNFVLSIFEWLFYTGFTVVCLISGYIVNSEIFARILFSLIALKDIFAT